MPSFRNNCKSSGCGFHLNKLIKPTAKPDKMDSITLNNEVITNITKGKGFDMKPVQRALDNLHVPTYNKKKRNNIVLEL
jgi:hypothetical protein